MKKLYIVVILTLGLLLCADTVWADTEGTQPKLIVSSYALDTDYFISGESAVLSVYIHNTNSTRSVRNIKLSISDSTNEILPINTSSIIHSYIAPGDVFEWDIEVSAIETAQDAPHILNIKMEYEDKYGRAYICEDTIIIDVIQPTRLEYSETDMPVRLTQGDVFSLEMNLMNMGKGSIYNALLTYNIEGIASGGSILVGSIEPGKTEIGKCNLKASGDALGQVSGNVIITYEDSRGRLYEEVIPVSTQIQEKISVDFTQNETELKADDPSQWKTTAIIFIILTTILLAVCAVTLIKITRLRRDYESKL